MELLRKAGVSHPSRIGGTSDGWDIRAELDLGGGSRGLQPMVYRL
ncbi:hypothetical protein [Terriglobus albidus]|nr:hypothetical protein [Terriglobus albidus]